MRPAQILEQARIGIVKAEVLLAAASLLLLLILSLTQIIARNFFETGFPVADTLARHLVLYVAFFGGVLGVESQRHIKIDVVSVWLSESWQARLLRPLYALGALTCGWMTIAATRFWIDEWTYAGTGEEWIAWLNFIIPLGFGLLTLHFALNVLAGEFTGDLDS